MYVVWDEDGGLSVPVEQVASNCRGSQRGASGFLSGSIASHGRTGRLIDLELPFDIFGTQTFAGHHYVQRRCTHS